MAILGNILWFIFGGGFFQGLAWFLSGITCCLTIIGIPFGIACFRIGLFTFFPFGKQLVPAEFAGKKRIFGTALMNFLWCIFCGIWTTISYFLIGASLCITIIGIPFGIACFKIGMAAFAPLGKRIMSKADVAAIYAARRRQVEEITKQQQSQTQPDPAPQIPENNPVNSITDIGSETDKNI